MITPEDLTIRPAKLEDFGEVTALRASLALDVGQIAVNNREYIAEIERKGFLLPSDLPIEEFQEALPNYLIADDDGKAIGYVRLSGVHEVKSEDEASWVRPDLKEAYFAEPHAVIWGICVAANASRRRIATKLLEAAEAQVREQGIPWLFSEIIVSPVFNGASERFHETNGFEVVAHDQPRSYMGMDDYQLRVYGKQLVVG